MSRLFRYTLMVWAVFHIAWILALSYELSGQWIFTSFVVIGTFTAIAGLLWDRLPLVRFLFLVGVLGYAAFVVAEADFATYYSFDYMLMASDPSTSWQTNVALLLNGAVLILMYVGPIGDDFERRRWKPETRVGSVLAAFVRSDGATIACITAAILVVVAAIQFELGASDASHSPRAFISGALAYLKKVEASGETWEKAIAYWEVADAHRLLGEHDEAAKMYERVLQLEAGEPQGPEASGVPMWILQESVSQLLQFYSSEPDERFGDGSKALKLAQTFPGGFAEPEYFDAVAAVHARLGQLEKAVENQKRAVLECTMHGECCERVGEYASSLREYRGSVRSQQRF